MIVLITGCTGGRVERRAAGCGEHTGVKLPLSALPRGYTQSVNKRERLWVLRVGRLERSS